MDQQEASPVTHNPEFAVDGSLLKIVYPVGHFYHPDGITYSFQCSEDQTSNQENALAILHTINHSLETVWKNNQETERKSREMNQSNYQPKQEDADLIIDLQRNTEDTVHQLVDKMSPTPKPRLNTICIGNDTTVDDIIPDEGKNVYLYGVFSLEGVKDPQTGEKYLLSLDNDLHIVNDLKKGIKYSKTNI